MNSCPPLPSPLALASPSEFCWPSVGALALRSAYGSPSMKREEAPEESEALSPIIDHLGMASF